MISAFFRALRDIPREEARALSSATVFDWSSLSVSSTPPRYVCEALILKGEIRFV